MPMFKPIEENEATGKVKELLTLMPKIESIYN